MGRSYDSPSKYVQGDGELRHIGAYAKGLGSKVLLVASAEDYARVREELEAAQSQQGFPMVFGDFNGRCTVGEVERLSRLCAEHGCDAVIGLGGGRALDAAKAVSFERNIPVIIVPTIASTDAPCSSVSVLYTEKGELARYLQLAQPPHVVLVDTGIIARAPVRFLVAGMGDALSTYFEARACQRALAERSGGTGRCTLAAMAIAERCYAALKQDSLQAKAACEAGKATEALENIVEANLLLSGLAFESCGLAAAHAVHNGLTLLEETRSSMHGEIVAFCVLVHLLLEGAPMEEIREVLDYNESIGLPTRLSDLGLAGIDEGRWREAAEAACAESGPMSNMPVAVTPELVLEAIWGADRLGRERQ